MSEQVARTVRIYGRVQGVFFRQWTLGAARELGVNGWVRNRSDGSVEAYLIGDQSSVLQMIDRMRRGPSQARVEDLVVEDADPEQIDGFSVRI